MVNTDPRTLISQPEDDSGMPIFTNQFWCFRISLSFLFSFCPSWGGKKGKKKKKMATLQEPFP